MLRLRNCILPHLFSSSRRSTSCIAPLHRLLSGSAAAASNPFTVADYLVARCGLSGEQALKASKSIPGLRSPSKPDAVIAFLAGLDISGTDLATVVAKDPRLLCADVGKTLSPRVAELRSLGLSSHQVGQVVLAAQTRIRSRSLGRNFEFWLGVFGSFDELLRFVKMNGSLLSVNLDKVAKPNLALLQRCGMQISDIPSTFLSRVLVRSTKHLQETLARVAELGIQQGSWAFPFAFMRFAIFNREKLDSNIQLFEKLGWSRDDIASAVRKAPNILNLAPERVHKNLDFLMGDVGLQMPDIVHRPVLLLYSVERRLLPRYYLMKFLKDRGLMTSSLSFSTIALMGNDNLLGKLVLPHEMSVPGLAAAYASSCAGKHQWELLGDMTKENRKS
ncbi:transcription termination factor MTERF8, chloroplastic-like [Miscanthus floridulus]|uniref:transcription termination factor MTERF8, chloroplastic-like n=1 Tax=Miscanthus floridulus TaxID=154761 RepID=UPI00345997F8